MAALTNVAIIAPNTVPIPNEIDAVPSFKNLFNNLFNNCYPPFSSYK